MIGLATQFSVDKKPLQLIRLRVEQDNITRAGAIAPLIALLDHHDLRELAAAVLAKLAHEHEDNQSATWRFIQLMYADGFGESEYGNGMQSNIFIYFPYALIYNVHLHLSSK